MLYGNLCPDGIHTISLFIVNINIGHGIAVNPDNINGLFMWIQRHKKQGVRLSPVGFILRLLNDGIQLINSHNQKGKDVLIVRIDIVLIFYPSLLPPYLLTFISRYRCH